MNSRIFFTALFLILTAFHLAAQGLPLAHDAARLCQEKKYNEAKTMIMRAIQDDAEKNNAYTWYVRGYIYKEIYKEKELRVRESEDREEAVVSFKKSLALDPSGSYTEMSKAALKYLATSYFNDALLRTREIDRTNEKDPEMIFQKFVDVIKTADPLLPIDNYEMELWKSLAQSHYRLWEKNTLDIYHANRSAEYYQQVMRKNPADCDAGFNLAILFYNQGVYKIRKIDSQTDINQLIAIQEESIRLFKQSMPFAANCFESCPKKLEHYKALMYINRAIGREDIYEHLLRESEALIKEGKLKN